MSTCLPWEKFRTQNIQSSQWQTSQYLVLLGKIAIFVEGVWCGFEKALVSHENWAVWQLGEATENI